MINNPEVTMPERSTGFAPPTIVPPARPLGTLRGLAAVVQNPLELWSDDMFDSQLSVMRLPGQKFVTVTDPELAKTVLLDDASAYVKSRYVNRLLKPAMGNGLLTAEGESWRTQRRAAAPAFRYEKIAALAPAIATAGEEAAAKLSALPPGTRIDIMDELVASTLDIIVEAMFGAAGEIHDRDAISRDITTYFDTHGNLDLFDYFGVPEWFPRPRHRGRAAIGRLRQAADAAIAHPRDHGDGRADLAALLTLARDPETGEALTRDELVDNILTFIGAGHETTALAVTWALSILAYMPELQEALGREVRDICGDAPLSAAHTERLHLHNRVVQETMRLYPPAAAVGRTAVAKTRLGSLDIDEQDHITIAVYVIQRHRGHWSNPQVFDPDRFLPENGAGRHRFAYMPFGGGGRICIGMKLALMEATILLATLMRRLRFTPDPIHKVYPQFSITLRPKGGMPLFVSPAGK
jgi:cytochrome P450